MTLAGAEGRGWVREASGKQDRKTQGSGTCAGRCHWLLGEGIVLEGVACRAEGKGEGSHTHMVTHWARRSQDTSREYIPNKPDIISDVYNDDGNDNV